MRIALLSNVNVDPVKSILEGDGLSVWSPDGYGDVFGALADAASGFRESGAQAAFVVIDTNALLQDCFDEAECRAEAERWFAAAAGLLPGSMPVYVTDASCRKDPFCADRKHDARTAVEAEWNGLLRGMAESRPNVFVLPLARAANGMGLEAFYSEKMWYLARMPHSSRGQRAIAAEIGALCRPAGGKKVLALDLDNTIWGGVVGELGPDGIGLSDERMGLVYKDVQREAKRMQRAGVVLVVASKNNPDDAMAAFRENGHMALSESDISAMKLNWERKDANLAELAAELNLGVDSFAFLDDNPTERDLVARMLPEVEVLAFPDDPSELPALLREEYGRLFRQEAVTEEDRRKGEQYAAFAKRAQLEASASSFEEYLESLEMRARAVDPRENLARVAQLVGKTNQFNLTTIRHSQAELSEMAASESHRVYAYELSDRFGNNGITAVAIVDLDAGPKIDTLILSCRIMGKRIEDFVVDRIESDVAALGFGELYAEYRPTKRNAPVKDLYDRLGYERVSVGEGGCVTYRLPLAGRPKRESFVKGE